MYRIMLADDEGIVIDALKFIIQKKFEGICQIEYAKTGRNVIELAERFRPDIAFMDIQMPGINGIEAMKEIKKVNQNTVFIIVSAYDNFDYAKEALNLGVLGYINKPIEQNAIVNILKIAMTMVDTEKEKRSKDLMIREKLETVVPIIESGFIYSVLFQENFADETDNFKELLGIREGYGYMIIIECGDSQEGAGHLTNAVGTSVKAQSYYHKLRAISKEHFSGIVGLMMANMVVIYVPCSSKNPENEYEERIEIIENARNMVRKLKKHIDAQFRVGIGSIKKLSEATDSYMEAMNSFHYAAGSVVHVKDLPIVCDYADDYPIEIEKALFEAIEGGDLNGSIAEANGFFEWMIGKYGAYMMDVKIKVLEFVLYAERLSYTSGGMTYYFRSRKDYLSDINSIKTLDELRSWFIGKLQEACRNIMTKKQESSASLVSKAKEYIKGHYSKDISLDDVSREVKISPYYFSKLFKEENGENFIDYVTNIRMEKAKQLLSKSNMSMKEICGEIGYSNPNYFSRSFKKNVGVTPTEYKEGK